MTFVQSYFCGNMLGHCDFFLVSLWQHVRLLWHNLDLCEVEKIQCSECFIRDPCVFYATEIVGSVSCEFLHDCRFGGDKWVLIRGYISDCFSKYHILMQTGVSCCKYCFELFYIKINFFKEMFVNSKIIYQKGMYFGFLYNQAILTFCF